MSEEESDVAEDPLEFSMEEIESLLLKAKLWYLETLDRVCSGHHTHEHFDDVLEGYSLAVLRVLKNGGEIPEEEPDEDEGWKEGE